MTCTINASKRAMENQASTEEETNTEEGATATPPGNEIPHNQAPHSHFQYSGMLVPYVEGPKMDWTIDNALHSRFIRWKLKCKNILDCELAILQESAKCKKWSSGQVMQDLICTFHGLFQQKKPHHRPYGPGLKISVNDNPNAVCAQFNLLTTFQQGNRSIDEWYNAVQVHIPICEYPPETAAILTRNIFFVS